MEFQIKQNYGKSGCGWIYFNAKPVNIDELKKIAIQEMVKDWERIIPSLYFSGPKKPLPTIEVAEYENGKKVKNGIRFKIKWR